MSTVTLQKGDRVILDGPRQWAEGPENPYWNGTQGKVLGTVREVRNNLLVVDWDNGRFNNYRNSDIFPAPIVERALNDVVTEITQQEFINKSAIFSAYDVTTKIRELVNAKKVILQGVPVENVDGVSTQRVKHDDVRHLVRTLVAANPAYIASYNGEYIEYRTAVPTPIVPAATVSSTVVVTPTGTTSTTSSPSTATTEFIIRGYVKRKTNPTLKQIQSRLKKDAPTVREIAAIVTQAGLRIDQRTPYYASVVTI